MGTIENTASTSIEDLLLKFEDGTTLKAQKEAFDALTCEQLRKLANDYQRCSADKSIGSSRKNFYNRLFGKYDSEYHGCLGVRQLTHMAEAVIVAKLLKGYQQKKDAQEKIEVANGIKEALGNLRKAANSFKNANTQGSAEKPEELKKLLGLIGKAETKIRTAAGGETTQSQIQPSLYEGLEKAWLMMTGASDGTNLTDSLLMEVLSQEEAMTAQIKAVSGSITNTAWFWIIATPFALGVLIMAVAPYLSTPSRADTNLDTTISNLPKDVPGSPISDVRSPGEQHRNIFNSPQLQQDDAPLELHQAGQDTKGNVSERYIYPDAILRDLGLLYPTSKAPAAHKSTNEINISSTPVEDSSLPQADNISRGNNGDNSSDQSNSWSWVISGFSKLLLPTAAFAYCTGQLAFAPHPPLADIQGQNLPDGIKGEANAQAKPEARLEAPIKVEVKEEVPVGETNTPPAELLEQDQSANLVRGAQEAIREGGGQQVSTLEQEIPEQTHEGNQGKGVADSQSAEPSNVTEEGKASKFSIAGGIVAGAAFGTAGWYASGYAVAPTLIALASLGFSCPPLAVFVVVTAVCGVIGVTIGGYATGWAVDKLSAEKNDSLAVLAVGQ